MRGSDAALVAMRDVYVSHPLYTKAITTIFVFTKDVAVHPGPISPCYNAQTPKYV